MSKYSIKQIFKDHWYLFLSSNPNIRNVVTEEVDKMLSCGDISKGFAVNCCEHRGKFEEIPRDVVEYFDEMDGGDPSVPPRFNCEKCDGLM